MPPQDRVIEAIRRRVDAWRGFPLGSAGEAYPDEDPGYEPVDAGESEVTPTTRALLRHWFRQEPHQVPDPRTRDKRIPFKYWPHQRRLVETVIYLYEACRIRRTEDIWRLAALEPVSNQRDPWTKLGGQLATGSGKTKMMSLLIAWAQLNASREAADIGLGRHALVIAPGLFVKERLLYDFRPDDGRPPVFLADPVIPEEMLADWDLTVYGPGDCPRRLDPGRGALVVTNYHQLLRTAESVEDDAAADRQYRLFEDGDPRKLEDVGTPLIDRFSRSTGLLVINDEAHHVWDETGHARFEEQERARTRGRGEAGDGTGMAWIRALRNLHSLGRHRGRVALQADLSATLFEETGSAAKDARKVFKGVERFRHTVVDYPLAEARRDGIIKWPVLERLEVKKGEQAEQAIDPRASNAWDRYRVLLETGIRRWKKVRDQMRAEGDHRKPILFILCDDQKEARQIANRLAYGKVDPDSDTLTGWTDPEGGPTLFVEHDANGALRSTVIQIHIGENSGNEEQWSRIRAQVNAVDHDLYQPPTPKGEAPPPAEPNPFNVVVSVMMLKEGWDVRNVKVIVPLRPCGSRTLTEQTLGRGLRKMHAPVIHETGTVTFHREELYVVEHPSFQAILDQIGDIVEVKSGEEIDHRPEYVSVEPLPDPAERGARDARLVRFDGLIRVPPDWRRSFDANGLPELKPRLPWMERFDDLTVQTWLRAAEAESEDEGQTFTLAAVPDWREYDQAVEQIHALPLLRDLRQGFQHKTAVKAEIKDYLERKTFAVPRGVRISFDGMVEDGEGRIAIANLCRPDVVEKVRTVLRPALSRALSAEHPEEEAQLGIRLASEVPAFLARKEHVLDGPAHSPFTCQAMENGEELRAAVLLDRCKDIRGWVYNHRQGVGFCIDYEFRGQMSWYYPDFLARAHIGEVDHHFIIEVKGRLDDRDKAKAVRGQRYAELLTRYDRSGEPWHYLLLIENKPIGREDITAWAGRSYYALGDLLARHETLPLVPETEPEGHPLFPLDVLTSVSPEECYRLAAPVIDLAAAAGSFGDAQEPEPIGWMRVRARRSLDERMFIARVVGRSMEPSIPSDCWVLFRRFPMGYEPPATSLDRRRVLVQLRETADPETGGRYTLKRWRITRRGSGGQVLEVHLLSDNPQGPTIRLTGEEGQVRVVGEFVEVVG